MDSQPEDIATLRAKLALARARNADDAATIARQTLEIAKLKRQIWGPRSERTARLLDQMELGLEELEAAATEDEIAAEVAPAKTTRVSAFTRKRPSRQPFPAHLLRERVVIPAPTTCASGVGFGIVLLQSEPFIGIVGWQILVFDEFDHATPNVLVNEEVHRNSS